LAWDWTWASCLGKKTASAMTKQKAVILRAVFTNGPKGLGPSAAYFEGLHIKKNRDWSMVCGKKKAVHEREI
jgi:hypothetical protein